MSKTKEKPMAVKELHYETGYSESYLYAMKRAAATNERSTFNCFVGPRALKSEVYRWLQDNTWFRKRLAYPSVNFKKKRKEKK
ncbi:MAG: hypothetical protein AAF636_11465 [Pseudomonadota bacterium]